jgi:hypothetical protein
LGDVFERKIMRWHGVLPAPPPPDCANASFAELFAWALAQLPAE